MRRLIAFAAVLVLLWNGWNFTRSAVADSAGGPVTEASLQNAYDFYNEHAFGGTLPYDAIVDFDEHDPDNMATTSLLVNGRYRISFNRKFITGERVLEMTMVHEQCHLVAEDGHGPRWQTCMIDRDEILKQILIDGYGRTK